MTIITMGNLLLNEIYIKETLMLRKKAKPVDELTAISNSLLEDLAKTKFALDTAYSNFENVTEPDLIDCYIYELNAAQMRYRFLLKKVKALPDNNAS